MRQFFKSAFFVLAAVYFTVDAIFLKVATPLARWIARKRIFIRARRWIGSLGPYQSLALFAIPVIILEPVKPVTAYLVSTGKFSAGISVLTIGEILKLVIVERLFKLCRYKLLKIPLFARGYGFWRQGLNWVRSMEAWQTARRWALRLKLLLRDHFRETKKSSTYRKFVRRLRIVRSRVQRLDN